MTIPYLPEPLRREVTLAYLLLRVTDTLEDATHWTLERRVASLREMAQLLEQPSDAQAKAFAHHWLTQPPCSNRDYLDVLHALPDLMGELANRDSGSAAIIAVHCRRTALGMAEHLAMPPTNLAELQQYCYVVAGIVGEMLTALLLRHLQPSPSQRTELESLAVAFGEGLQLVNIVKDAATDHGEGRQFLPQELPLDLVFSLAQHNLQQARRYGEVLFECAAPMGILMFTHLPCVLAEATLERVRQRGAGAKLSRTEVATLCAELETTISARIRERPPVS